jgi:hypothetical protein
MTAAAQEALLNKRASNGEGEACLLDVTSSSEKEERVGDPMGT